jgi:hypothetical protein
MVLRITPSIQFKIIHREVFSRDFARGLGLAIAFHVIFYLLFRIASQPNLDIVLPLDPTRVEIDLSCDDCGIIPVARSLDSPLSSPECLPFIDPFNYLPPIGIEHVHLKLKKSDFPFPDFSELEQITYQPIKLESDDCYR